MGSIAVVDTFLDELKNPDSGYYGAAACFLFAAIHASRIRDTFLDGSQDVEDELKDLIASGIHAFRMDDEVYAKKDANIDELSTWIDQYSYFAARIIGWGQDSGDRMFIYPSLCIADAISTMEEKLSALSGQQANPVIDQALMPLDTTDRTVADDIVKAPIAVLENLEARVGLSLFHKLLVRRARLRKEPPVDIPGTLEQVDSLLSQPEDAPLDAEKLSDIAKLAGICYRNTKSLVRSDYAFVDRILTAIAKEQRS